MSSYVYARNHALFLLFLLSDVDEAFDERYISTIGVDFRIKTMERQNKVVKLQIWDTAGQERFRAITTSYYRGADGILMVYDVTGPSSITALGEVWIRDVRNFAFKKPRVQLVGNKADMKARQEPETTALVEERLHALLEMLAEDGVVASTEASAKDGTGVASAFEGLVDHMLNARAAVQRTDTDFRSLGKERGLRGGNKCNPIDSASLCAPSSADDRKPLCCNLL
jgi:small GTP-binding protein